MSKLPDGNNIILPPGWAKNKMFITDCLIQPQVYLPKGEMKARYAIRCTKDENW